ncbi:MAG: UDP-3-O-acyl-N-acetylglucosamine deacetylase [Armatimonadetes bacterium]|nr:UDP-3-O-acyl-N-acetylglucosamine deacetylase [Armatimonadota bacterium]
MVPGAAVLASAVMRHKTLACPVTLSGIGVHCGAPAQVRILPRQTPGIRLRRADGAHPEIAASLDAISGDARRTSLGGIATVEHLLAAAYALGLSAMTIEIDGPEVPILDGSAAPFFDALAAGGTAALPGDQPVLRVTAPVWIHDGDQFAAALPLHAAMEPAAGPDGLRLTYQVTLRDGPDQVYDLALRPAAFREEIASARTWGYLDEVDALRAAGLARGASLDNTLAIANGRYHNPPRWEDEPARHKLLDLVGDLSLLGARLVAHVLCARGGHALHLALARAVALRFPVTPARDADAALRRIAPGNREA